MDIPDDCEVEDEKLLLMSNAITTHETILNFMIKKGYYHAYDLEEQYKVDMKTTDTALNLTGNNM